jgi:3'(2'), 5'-bisphosphate nucleotidase
MAYYGGALDVDRKADSSPVTAADRESEAILIEALAKAAPGIPVVAEESVASGSIPMVGDAFFLVDPLDGTREFINKCGEFTINVGLIEAGRPVFGLVYAPALGELFATIGPGRAVMTEVAPDAPARALTDYTLRPLLARIPDAAALVAVESRSHRNAKTEAYLARFAVQDSRRCGSSLKFCLIAKGEADFYPRLGETSEWDTAAGQAILEAAGGTVVMLDGAPLRYGKSGSGFLNPHFVAWGRSVIAPRL